MALPEHRRYARPGLYEGLDWLSGTLKSMQSRGLRTSVGTSGAKGTNFSAAGVKSVMSFF